MNLFMMIFGKILDEPNEPKFQDLNRYKIYKKLRDVPSAVQLLFFVGFEESTDDEILRWKQNVESMERLKFAYNALNQKLETNMTSNIAKSSRLRDIDLTIFKESMGDDLQCDGSPTGKCKALCRMMTLLRYHHSLMASGVANPTEIFIEFCDSAYDKTVATNDYIHFIQKHSDNISRRQIVKELDLKCSAIDKCIGSRRHFERNDFGANEHETKIQELAPTLMNSGEAYEDTMAAALISYPSNSEYNFFLDQFDTLHFNLIHIEEVAFRATANDQFGDEKVDEDNDMDSEMRFGSERARTIGTMFDSERWNSGTNSKFNIAVHRNETPKQKGILNL